MTSLFPVSFLDCKQWTPKNIETLFERSRDLQSSPVECAKGKILINAFFEPSTRTSLSFECAMKRLGGEVITFCPSSSSIQKGENDYDTIRSLETYGDAIVLRHPSNTFMYNIRPYTSIPMINAGNGDGDHPTQALTDLYTLYNAFGAQDFQQKTILFIGDISHSRTIHSFITLLHLYPQTKLFFMPYEGCEPDGMYLRKIAFIHHQELDEMIVDYDNEATCDYHVFDVVYITREQKERHVDGGNDADVGTDTDTESEANSDDEMEEDHAYSPLPFCFTNNHANKLREDAIIMHPLPRNHELHRDVDQNHRAYYFKQMEYGVELRMGLLDTLFTTQQQQHEENHDFFPSYTENEVSPPHHRTQEWVFVFVLVSAVLFYTLKYK